MTISGSGEWYLDGKSWLDFMAEAYPYGYSYAYSQIESVVFIGDEITDIGIRAFDGLDKLKKLTIPESVSTIGRYAFQGCINLERIEIPKNVSKIYSDSFRYCRNLNSISVDPDNEVYDSRDNCNAIINKETNSMLRACSNTIIPESVTTIGALAYSGCLELKEFIIPEMKAVTG